MRRRPGASTAALPKPNKRLDGKTGLFDYERWNRDWARNATDPASYAPEYEGYIRQIEPTHGHDPGLVYARDFAQRVQDIHGNGGAFVQSLLNRLVDRPDLQRAFLGGEVPQHPPQGTFRPGGEAGIKQWIDQDRVANGIAPKYSKAAQTAAPEQRLSSRAAASAQTAPTQEPDPKNILEYVPNFGWGDEATQQGAQMAEVPAGNSDAVGASVLAAEQLAQAQGGRQQQQPTPGAQPTPPAARRRGPLPAHAPLYSGQPQIGARDMGPVPPLTSIGNDQRPTKDDIRRHEAFVRAARQLPGIGPREIEVLRHLWATEGGDRIDPRPTGASSGITNKTYQAVVAGGRVAGLEPSWRSGDVPTDLRPGVMRDTLDQMLARAGGVAALERFEDQTVANAIANTIYYVGPSDGGTSIREALRKTMGENLPPSIERLPTSGALRLDVMNELLPVLNDPSRRDAFLENLANARVPHLARQLGKAPESLTEAELAPINRYRPSRQGR